MRLTKCGVPGLVLAVSFTTLAWAEPATTLEARRPNIVFLLTDDQGYGDLSCHGNPILKTPNLDRLHAEGVRFTDFHVSPTCSPTRSALMTGRHEFKNGVTHTILERERLTLKAATVAQVLKSAGYVTGIFGKWHLGDEAAYQPDRRGFDEVFIHGCGGIGQSYSGSCGDVPGNSYFSPTILHNGKFEKTTGYCTDVFFSQALHWIESVKGQKPFFCYLPTNAPHAPLDVRPEDEKRYADRVKNPSTAKFFGMIANIDDNVGRLLDKLKEWGLERDTLVIFMNDNGGTAGVSVHNAGMRGQKVTPWGGTRASSFWRWPGTLKAGAVDRLAAHIDVFPTLAEIAGAKLTDDVRTQVEGRSLAPLLCDTRADWPDRVLFTHIGRWPKGAKPAEHKYAHCSVRSPRWHLVCDTKDGSKQWQLFDVKSDPGEKTDVAAKHPEVVQELDAAYDRWWDAVQPGLVNENAIGPKVNPFKELYEKQLGREPESKGGPARDKDVASAGKPVKVFILAGQSNMEGKAPNSLLDYQATDAKTRDVFAHLRKNDKWIVRDDVFIKFLDRRGPLTVGYGSPGRTGVELEFGTVMGDHFDEPVVLIKAAWGGHSLCKLFRSPSAGYPAADVLQKELDQAQANVKKNNEKNKKNDLLPTLEDVKKAYGSSYRNMMAEVKDVQANYETMFPALKGKKVELAGFVWFQGWNDQYGGQDEYESNMKNFIHDVRKDLHAPKLPFVIGAMGQNGSKPAGGAMLKIQQAQLAMNDVPEFKGNVKTIRTDVLVDKAAEELYPTWQKNFEQWKCVGGDHAYHYLGSAIWFNRIGKAMGEAMLQLLNDRR